MLIKFMIGALVSSLASFAHASTVKVINLKVAQTALVDVTSGGGAIYVQDGAASRPDKIDYSRLYCFTSGVHFRLSLTKTYPIESVKAEPIEDTDSGTWSTALKIDPQSVDPIADFEISCMSSKAMTIEEIGVSPKRHL